MRDKIILRKMLNHCEDLLSIYNGESEDEFLKDLKLTLAAMYVVGQLGELANKLKERKTLDTFCRSISCF
ncbi:hypothetical protein [Defluviitalea raffinosedens]|jgi:uncharacterized protein with HEPN domain|uniref:hypothetical protein n=1 Tax=Defluviitalea raffinosedens TaxID=1450156 RepID=UPI00195E65C4|nr:hypothetical protein [Defluviitalea raffinosedens]MBM7685765.1 uncharacterized protein with HEPN domain [Defluviitalea raffinosedens]MBZ4668965.1 hypothetical protein [Defluviitaleaceae bacterium]